MATYGKYLNPERKFRIPNGIKYLDRTKHTITHNPSKAVLEETLFVRVPKPAKDVLLVPGSVCVSFDLTVKGHVNNHIRNNLGRIIVSRLVVTYGRENLFDLNYYNVFKTYCDLFMSPNDREHAVYQGISNLKLIKLRSGAGDAQNSGDEGNLFTVFGRRFMIPIDFEMLTDHAPFYPYEPAEDLVFELTLAPATDTIFRGSEPGTRGYEMTLYICIALEYETVSSK